MKTFRIAILVFAAFLYLQSCRDDEKPNKLDGLFSEILSTPVSVPVYQIDTLATAKMATVRFEFGSNQLTDSTELERLKRTEVKYIRYVYTDYKKDDEFKQDEFNKERLYEIYKAMPELFEKPDDVHWEIIAQTGATNEKEAEKLFHGLVIYYRDRPTAESMKEEVAYLSKRLSAFHFSGAHSYTETILYMTGDSVVSEYGDGSFEEGYRHDGEDDSLSAIPEFADTVVSVVLKRNKHWNDMLIACDLTGSMSPYSAQLFIWHKLNLDKKKVQHFCFFNDGDMTPDEKKITGKTGGIYFSDADNFNALEKVAYKCMENGGGGDAPENDVEALLSAIEKYPESKDIILIADNWADMRDYSLLSQIDRPVKVILCGTEIGLNSQYLDLAKATKGSIHTIEDDIVNLMALKEGEEIKIGKQKFKISDGQFVEVQK